MEFDDLLDEVDDGFEPFQLSSHPLPLSQPESSKSHPSVGWAIKINLYDIVLYI